MQKAKRSQVQNILWDMMPVILSTLEENKLQYYMLGGTLLGAIRHNGFIPWDDDLDIGLPREDYDVFLDVIRQRLPEHLALRTYQDDTHHHYYFSRIVDTRYKLKRKGSIEEREEEAWIDIFPLDGMPNDPIRRMIHKTRLLYARARYHIATFDKVNLKRPGRPLSERIIIALVARTGFGRNSDAEVWLKKIDGLLRRYPIEESKWIINFMGQYKFKEMFPVVWYSHGKLYPFEDQMLNGPVEYDKVLRQQYGEYMEYPQNKNAHAAELIRKE